MYTHTLRCKVALQLVYTVLQGQASSRFSHLEVIGTECLKWFVCWPAYIFQLQLGALAQIDCMTCIVKHGRIHVQPNESLHLCYDLVVHCIPIIFVRQFRSCYMVECRLSLGGSYRCILGHRAIFPSLHVQQTRFFCSSCCVFAIHGLFSVWLGGNCV